MMTRIINKSVLTQFLLYAPNEIDVEQLMALIEAKAINKGSKGKYKI